MRVIATALALCLGLAAASEASAQIVLRSNTQRYRPMQRLQPNTIIRLVRYERITVLWRGRTRVFCGRGQFPVSSAGAPQACRLAAIDDRRRASGAVRGPENGLVADIGLGAIDTQWGGHYCFRGFDNIAFIDPPAPTPAQAQRNRTPPVPPIVRIRINGVAVPMQNGRAVWPAGVPMTDGSSYSVSLERANGLVQPLPITLHRLDFPAIADPAQVDPATGQRVSEALEQQRCLAQLTWLGARLPIE